MRINYLHGSPEPADVCLVLEGTYPYVSGGVAAWAHELLLNQPDLTFHIVTFLAPGAPRIPKYILPDNVVGITPITLQYLESGRAYNRHDLQLLEKLEPLLTELNGGADAAVLASIIKILQPQRKHLGARVLLESPAAWNLVQRMYRRNFIGGSFLEYYWSWRSIFGGLFSVLLPEIPRAGLYHALCTGFAGLFAARAALETERPMVLTEHGIYTNERRIELGTANWFREINPGDLGAQAVHTELRDIWIKMFATYSRICYQVASPILTLFGDNQQIQQREGAESSRLGIIPNGVDVLRYGLIARKKDHPPTVALIGRVVPIKGVKTFISACLAIKQRVPNVRALILGPQDEDPMYYAECRALVNHLGLQDTVLFLGQVKLDVFLGEIDVVALTSVSEAQPLVILEAGAAGVPSVATNVGACREMIFGCANESPRLGAGGAIAKVADSFDIAEQICTLLLDPELRQQCGEVMRNRVKRYYSSVEQHGSYRSVYDRLLGREVPEEVVLQDEAA